MRQVLGFLAAAATTAALVRWYRHEVVTRTEAQVRLQSEHEHFHLHVDLPDGLQIQPGDTLEILALPETQAGRTHGELTYTSPVRLYKASWLKRNLTRQSSLIEINELVEHP